MASTKLKDGAIETRLKVLTWNIWWRLGPWEQRHPAIVKTLKSLDADIIALQEVWADDATNHAAELAKELGYYHVYAQSMEMNDLGFGNAILSRWPIISHESIDLYYHEGSYEKRLAVYAEIDGPRGVIPVFNTHLNWKHAHSHVRQRQVSEVAQFVADKAMRSYPPVLCGDFNAEPDSDEIRMLKGLTTCPVEELFFHDAWTAAGNLGPGFTWDNINEHAVKEYHPNRRIDYVFVGEPKRKTAGHITDCRIAADAPIDGMWPSDHLAVLAELRY